MQESRSKEVAAISNHSFIRMIERAKNGDNDALTMVLQEMEPEIQYLAGFLKMSKEDGIQEIKTQFIEKLRDGKDVFTFYGERP
ncbi:helix-turn-helix domain-containing protein [Brevibacillus borstelensis]|uniref:helix-turn-helix domain-containing protein n=1 Tax=Brevibacillus borstelensis TaxID=45462 RepID=UPI0030EE2B79